MTEQRILAASRGVKFNEASAMDIYTTLAKIAVLTGQQVPIAKTMELIATTIMDVAPWVTLQDIELACLMNINNQLPEVVQPYGEFSVAYLCAILNHYKPIRGKAVLKYREITERADVSRQLAPPVVTDEEWRQMIATDARSLRAGKDHWRYTAARMCQYLEDSGALNDATFTPEEWKEFNRRAKAAVMDRHRIGPNLLASLPGHERARFDEECVAEKKTIVYEWWLKNKVQEVVG